MNESHLYGISFAKNNNRKQNGKSRRKNTRGGNTREINIRAPARSLQQVPRMNMRSYIFRRSWNQQLAYNPVSGWNTSGSGNIQLSFGLSSSAVVLGGITAFTPATPGASEITALFDQYKIKRVITRFDWSNNSYDPVTSAGYGAPLFYYVVDHDDTNNGTVSDLLQYPGVGTHSFLTNGYKPLIIEHTPRPLVDVASTGILTAYSPAEKNPFIRTFEPDVPHYGLKIATGSMGASANANIGYCLITNYIEFEVIDPK